MSAAFDAFLACQNPAPVILAEIQPAQALGPWTKVGGLTSTYSCPFSQYVQTDVVAGGLYRRLDQVRQDATLLTSRASSALVDANLGSCFYDVANSLIYVSMTDGNSPETWAFVGAWFTIFFASTSVRFSDQPLYEPRVVEGLPTLEQEKPDLLFGATISDAGSVVLSNADALFDKLSRLWFWRNKLVTFKLGGTNGDTGAALAYSDYATVGAMLINTATPDDETFTLQLDTIGSVLNRSIPTRGVLPQFSYLDPTLNLSNILQPWLIGTAKDCKMVFVGTVASQDNYLPIDNQSFLTINNNTVTVYAVSKATGAKTPLVSGVDYFMATGGLSFNLTVSGTIAYPNANYEIWFDGSTVNVASTFGALVSALLQALGVPTSQIDSAAFAAIDAVSPVLGVYLTSATAATDVIRAFEQSVNAQVYVRTEGVWTCRLFDPSLDRVTYTLSDADFVSWAPDDTPALASSLSEVRAQYDARQATGIYFEAAQDDSRVQYENETTDTTSIQTYLRNASDASALVAHDQFLKGAAPCRVTAEQRGLSLLTASVGDMVAVTRARGPVARTGRLDGQLFEIIKLTKALAGTNGVPVVTAVLEDLGGQTDRIGRYTDGTIPDWSSATDAQRAVYGWYCDGNGYLDPTDITTQHAKVAL